VETSPAAAPVGRWHHQHTHPIEDGSTPGSSLSLKNSTVTGNHTPDGSVVGGNGAGISNCRRPAREQQHRGREFRLPRAETTGGDFSIDSGLVAHPRRPACP
jgi:hypothetical protein